MTIRSNEVILFADETKPSHAMCIRALKDAQIDFVLIPVTSGQPTARLWAAKYHGLPEIQDLIKAIKGP